jgi:hypothetical protein
MSPGTKAGLVTGLQVFKHSRCNDSAIGTMKVICICIIQFNTLLYLR